MNVYTLLPLFAFFANISLGFYILYRNPKGKVNILYALVAFSVAVWSLGDFLVFTSPTPESAIYWDKLSTLGSMLVPVFLLHFFLIFTKSELASKRRKYLLYIPAMLFGFLNFATNLIPDSAELNYWGYGVTGGSLYAPFISYIIIYVFAGLFLSYRFYSKTQSAKEKIQAKLLIVSISISLVGGVVTEAVPTILGFKIMPLTSSLSTLTALIIAYTIIKHKLMTPISFSIQRKMIMSFLVVAVLMGFIGYSGIYALNHLDASTKKILEEQQTVMTHISDIRSDLLVCRLKLDQYIATQNKAHLNELERILNRVNKTLILVRNKISKHKERDIAVLDEIENAFWSYKNLINSIVSFYEKNPNDKETISTKKLRIDSLLDNALLVKLNSLYAIEEEEITKLVEHSHVVYTQSIWNIIFFSLILIGVGGVSSFLISRSIANPLIKMAKITQKIAKGEFEHRLNIKSKDEIGELASAFNKMTRDLRNYHEQIKRHAEELEEKVAKRTKELNTKVKELTNMKTAMLNMMEDMDETNRELIRTEDELKKTLQELKEMDVKKDQFISIAAHELKTPLTSIHGFSQLLQNKKIADDPAKREKYLKIMDRETKRLAKLVDDILNLSRIDLGAVKLAFEKVDVNELMDSVRREMEVQIKKKGLKSECIIEKGLPKIVTDREKLTQILINLISNAVKYTEKGKITVKVFKDNEHVHFMVKDTGIGIAKDQQEKIFERFYQIDSSYTRKAGGTGLGLALCREFVTLLGGKIWVKSKKGKGSEFHFVLPVKGVPEQKIKRQEEKVAKNLKKVEEIKNRLKEIEKKKPAK
ncbi:MAG: HAMP domain-containing protein [Candidatus Aenigmarchaeota archaeon]|nr:HAMP domain-containing protein [Candidatus Aenigmarchaeota archaeon]